jgi:hypothetical protein
MLRHSGAAAHRLNPESRIPICAVDGFRLALAMLAWPE